MFQVKDGILDLSLPIYHKQAAQISLFPCHVIQNFHVGIVPIPGFIQVLFDTSYVIGHSQCPKGAVRRQNTPKRLSSAWLPWLPSLKQT